MGPSKDTPDQLLTTFRKIVRVDIGPFTRETPALTEFDLKKSTCHVIHTDTHHAIYPRQKKIMERGVLLEVCLRCRRDHATCPRENISLYIILRYGVVRRAKYVRSTSYDSSYMRSTVVRVCNRTRYLRSIYCCVHCCALLYWVSRMAGLGCLGVRWLIG